MARDLTGAEESDSVHLADWPAVDAGQVDPSLEEGMALARRLSSLGRAARSEAGVKVRQPLARAVVYLPPDSPPLPPGIVEDELNVDRVEVTAELGDVLAYELVPNFKLLGPRIGKRVQALRTAMTTVDTAAAAAELTEGRSITVELADGPVDLGADEVELRVRAQPGFAVSRDGAEVLALDLALDDDLRRRGLAREVVRNVQDLRKETGLEVSDTIVLYAVGIDDLTSLFDTIAREVLAVRIQRRRPRPVPGQARSSPSTMATRPARSRSGSRSRDRDGAGDGPRGAAASPVCWPSTWHGAARRWPWWLPRGGSSPMPPSRSPSTCSTAGAPNRTLTSWWSAIRRAAAGPWAPPAWTPATWSAWAARRSGRARWRSTTGAAP